MIIPLALVAIGILGLVFEIQAYAGFFQPAVLMEKNREISSKEPLVIDFSRAVVPGSYDGKIKILPGKNAKIEWKDGNKKLIITPDNFWKPETDYTLSLGEGKDRLFMAIAPIALKFSTIAYPQVVDFSPADGAKDILLDIEDPIVVDFDRSTEDFFVKFELDPPVGLVYENNPEKTRFKLLPSGPAKEGQRYAVKISAKLDQDAGENYKDIYSSSFETAPPKIIAWDKNFSARVEQAKTFTRPRIFQGKYIDINLSAQILSIFENGTLLDSFLVSTGKRGMETPKGTFAIANKTPRAWSKAYGLFMPNWMAILPSGKVGIHELPEWPGGYKEGANHLGIPVSHGCVRLGVGPAKRVYDWAEIGTPVVVY